MGSGRAIALAASAAALALLHAPEGLPDEIGWRVDFWVTLGLAAFVALAAVVALGAAANTRAGRAAPPGTEYIPTRGSSWLARILVACLVLSLVGSGARWAAAAPRENAKPEAHSADPNTLGVRQALGAKADPPAATAPRDDESSPLDAPTPCGKERWAVKTLSDAAADEVRSTAKSASVDELTALTPPPTVGPKLPRTGKEERTVYRITAELRQARHVAEKGGDRDIHLVVAAPGSGRTMIVEFPDVSCPGPAGSRFRDRMLRARAAFESACGKPIVSDFTPLAGTAQITGVGYFDKRHGQRGVADNGIELHPVLGFKSSDCAAGG